MNKSTRDTWSETILEIAEKNKNIVVLSADSELAMRLTNFKNKYPDRYIEVGIAEQNLVNIGAGLAASGKIPFVTSYSVFLSMRSCEQVRTFVAYPKLNVKFIGANGGIYAGEKEGPTHQALEDLSIFRTFPNMMVLSPTDANETMGAVRLAVEHNGPVYIRLGGPPTPVYSKSKLTAGKVELLADFGNDLVIFATGIMVFKALESADALKNKGIYVKMVKVDKIKPIDKNEIIKYLKETEKAITCEDHLINGGLGSAISEIIAENASSTLKRIGIRDCFPESGTGEELFDKYKMNSKDIVKAAEELIGSKRK